MWLKLLNNSLAGRPAGPLLMTLATIDNASGVDARTVVCREISPEGTLWFTSDSRSRKNAQIAIDARASAVLWVSHRRHQFRFQGSVESESKHRDRFWNELPDTTKASFFWPRPGSSHISGTFDAPAELAQMPETFSVLRLAPIIVELLELEPSPHRRRRWQAATSWRVEELNP